MERRLQKEKKQLIEKGYNPVLTKKGTSEYFFSATVQVVNYKAKVENIVVPYNYPFGKPDVHKVKISLFDKESDELISGSVIQGKQAISQRLMRSGIVDPEDPDEVRKFHNLFSLEDWGPTLTLEWLIEENILRILRKYVLLFSKKRKREDDELAAAIELSKRSYLKKLKF